MGRQNSAQIILDEKLLSFLAEQENEPNQKNLVHRIAPVVMAIQGLIYQPLLKEEFIALVSFALSMSPKEFANSKVVELINLNDFESAGEQILFYNKDKHGRVSEELTARRKREKELFLSL